MPLKPHISYPFYAIPEFQRVAGQIRTLAEGGGPIAPLPRVVRSITNGGFYPHPIEEDRLLRNGELIEIYHQKGNDYFYRMPGGGGTDVFMIETECFEEITPMSFPRQAIITQVLPGRWPNPEDEHENVSVGQIIDILTDDGSDLYRYGPDGRWVIPKDMIEFLDSIDASKMKIEDPFAMLANRFMGGGG